MFECAVLGANIKKFRQQMGLTQAELAEKLFVSSQSVSKWECGMSAPDLDNLCALSEALEVSVDILLGMNEGRLGETLIAIDGGGTKTEFLLFTPEGKIINRLVLGGSNPNHAGIEKSCEVLRAGIDLMLSYSKNVSAIFAGVAGCALDKNRNSISDFLKAKYPSVNIKCRSDILNVTGCEPKFKDCIAAICGTGNVVFAVKDEKINRVGGWGYLLDGAGSGYDIGRDALRASLADRDGIGERSLITSLVEERLGGQTWNFINQIYSSETKYIASFAPLVFEAYEKGDETAEKILQNNAAYLAHLITSAAEIYNAPKKLVISGGLVKESAVFADVLRSHLPADMEMVIPSKPQIYGCCVQCIKMLGLSTEGLEKNFDEEYKKFKQ